LKILSDIKKFENFFHQGGSIQGRIDDLCTHYNV